MAKRKGRRPRVEALEGRQLLTIFLVTNGDDTNTPGTLRNAILQANVTAGPNTIDFVGNGNGGPNTLVIRPTSPLPAVTAPVLIDGTSAPGFTTQPLVVIDGGLLAGQTVDGLTLNSAGITVQSIAVDNFGGAGIAIIGPGSDVVTGSYLGLDPTGKTAQPNGVGLRITGSANNTIGGFGGTLADLISGNLSDGVVISGAGSTGNILQLDLIGIGADQTTPIPNGTGPTSGFGVRITAGASGTTIVGATVSANAGGGIGLEAGTSNNAVVDSFIGTNGSGDSGIGNGVVGISAVGSTGLTVQGDVIAGNAGPGVSIAAGSSNALIRQNRIGTSVGGVAALPNLGDGVIIDQSAGAAIGSGDLGPNIISGNTGVGVRILGGGSTGAKLLNNVIGLDANIVNAIPNGSDGVLIDGAPGAIIGQIRGFSGNIISGNTADGIHLINGAAGTRIGGNLIGTDGTGTVAVGNRAGGILIDDSPGTLIGSGTSPTSPAANLISGNLGDGIQLNNPATSGTVIDGNLIGTSFNGLAAIPNTSNGIVVNAAPGTTIGGGAARSNVISGNSAEGISIRQAGSAGAVVTGNFIGLDATGLGRLGNGGTGLNVSDVPNVTIGGISAGLGNVISANAVVGVGIFGLSSTADLVEGNLIGTDATGAGRSDARGTFGNTFAGILVGMTNSGAASGVTIGGLTRGAGNVVGGQNGANSGFGILLNNGSTNDLVIGNRIGIDANGAGYGNAGPGVTIFDASNNTVGGNVAGAGNVISDNGQEGVLISGSNAANNVVAGNTIGLDLAGNALGNGHNGVAIAGGAFQNTIGGPTLADRNLISANGFAGTGLGTNGVAIVTGSQRNAVFNNFIGTDPTGLLARPNAGDGVLIDSSTLNAIGGDPSTLLLAGNLIASNLRDGVRVNNSTNTIVVGNTIGLDAAGNILGNAGDGIAFLGGQSHSAGTFQFYGPNSGNVVSGNGGNGITIVGMGGNGLIRIEGNKLGTSADGLTARPNTLSGLSITDSPGNFVDSNLISGNLHTGVSLLGTTTSNRLFTNTIGLDANGNALGNGTDGVLVNTTGAGSNTIGETTANGSNVISGNGTDGIAVLGDGTGSVLIQNNLIGTTLDGLTARPNAVNGINIDAAQNVTIGGTSAPTGNLISANGGEGILVQASAGIAILGNIIGLDNAGLAMGNHDGIQLLNSSGVTIGGLTQGAGNAISGNFNNGVLIGGGGGNQLINNRIGTSTDGVSARPNGFIGVLVQTSVGDTIGGTTAGSGNLISANRSGGVILGNTTNTRVDGNIIGLNVNGNVLGNGYDGIRIDGSLGVIVGGPAAGMGNAIGGNTGNGVELLGIGNGIQVVGNRIGTSPDGLSARPNGGSGVYRDGRGTATIGGTTPGSGNLISGNTQHGIEIVIDANTSTLIASNTIGLDATGNARLGNGGNGILQLGTGQTTIGGSVASGNIIGANAFDGIALNGAGAVVIGNTVGTNPAGATGLGNALVGLRLQVAQGAVTTATDNVFSGNGLFGIYGVGSNNLFATGNLIGTGRNGTEVIPNGQSGILLDGTAATIGTNVIANNGGAGIVLENGPASIAIAGNVIGATTATPNAGNKGPGVLVVSTSGVQLVGNTIGGNGADGIFVLGDPTTGMRIAANTIGGAGILQNRGAGIRLDHSSDAVIGTTVINGTTPEAGNTIVGNVGDGITLYAGSNNNTILGNLIGGPGGLGNGGEGIRVVVSTGNLIGASPSIGTESFPGNTIGGNVGDGVGIFADSSGNIVRGNVIGAFAGGPGNGAQGISIDLSSTGNTIGGAFPNTIRGNVGNGIQLAKQSNANVVAANVVVGNVGTGIYVNDSSSNSIVGNTVAGNRDGIGVFGHNIGNPGGQDATSNVIVGNLIGGLAGAPVNLGNGIDLGGDSATVVRNNLIGGNAINGLLAEGSVRLLIDGNRIGVAADEGPAANGFAGVNLFRTARSTVVGNLIGNNAGNGVLLDQAGGNTIGGVLGTQRNTIAGNGSAGVTLQGGSAGNVVLGNAVGLGYVGPFGARNSQGGIIVRDSPGNVIGVPHAGNLVGNNAGPGIWIQSLNTSSAGNIVDGNVVGLGLDGITPAPNALDGITVESTSNVVVRGNTVSANVGNGIRVVGKTATGTTIANNVIGLDLLGKVARGNSGDGILIDSASNTSVTSNVVGGNGNVAIDARASFLTSPYPTIPVGLSIVGNVIGLGLDSRTAIGNGEGILTDGYAGATIATNLVDNSRGNAISFSDASNPSIVGNVIGLAGDGLTPAPNGGTGIGVFLANSPVIRGNTVASGRGDGLQTFGTRDMVIAGNRIGTDVSGTLPRGNAGSGIRLNESAVDRIGGTDPADRNVIAANGGDGITVLTEDPMIPEQTFRLSILGNTIGLDALGRSRPGLGNGTGISVVRAGYTTIGGTTAAAANLIGGNLGIGVDLNGARSTSVMGNRIGLDAAGGPAPNGSDGVFVDNAPTNFVGGNVIGSNPSVGVQVFGPGSTGVVVQANLIGLDPTGTLDRGNGLVGVYLNGAPGARVLGNVVAANHSVDIQVVGAGARGSLISGNTIGLDASGTRVVGTQVDGLLIESSGNTVGGSTAGARNLISGATAVGVHLYGPNGSGNLIQGNLIGLDAAGTHALGNRGVGLLIDGATGNTVAGNTITGSGSIDVDIAGASATGNLVAGNLIGTDITGQTALSAAPIGVFLNGSPGNTIGGTTPGADNLIAGHGQTGLQIFAPGGSRNLVVANRIGPGPGGPRLLKNRLGVFLNNAPNNTIGGTTAGAANIIVGNTTNTILTAGKSAIGNQTSGNVIGPPA